MCCSGASGSGSLRIIIWLLSCWSGLWWLTWLFAYDTADYDQKKSRRTCCSCPLSGQDLCMILLTIKSTHRVTRPTVSHQRLIKNHYSFTKSDLWPQDIIISETWHCHNQWSSPYNHLPSHKPQAQISTNKIFSFTEFHQRLTKGRDGRNAS